LGKKGVGLHSLAEMVYRSYMADDTKNTAAGEHAPCDSVQTETGGDEGQNAYFSFLGVAGIGYVGLLIFIVTFGLFGDTLTSGVDDACAEASFQGGQKALDLGNYDLAIRRFRRALDGQFVDKQREYECGRSLCETLYRLERYDEAVDAYRALPPGALTKPGHMTAYVSSLWRGGNAAEAERLGRQWLDMAREAGDTTQESWACGTLGGICQEANRLDEALSYYRRGSAIAPDSQLTLSMAVVLHALGRDDEAIRELDAFLNRVPMGNLHEQARKLRNQCAGKT